MAIIYTNQKSKAKKKPGWEKAQKDHDEWLKSINSMALFDNKKPKKFAAKRIDPVIKTDVPTITDERKKAFSLPSRQTTIKGGGIPYVNPAVLYKENPDMLERELKARERKFTTAPIYNKGADTMITDEMMKDITAGITRRR